MDCFTTLEYIDIIMHELSSSQQQINFLFN
jgi:hypothetical protein